MAKSIRSKSQRKARAVKHAAVFKAVEDSRTNRLSEKLKNIPVSANTISKITTGDSVMSDDNVEPLVKTGHRKKSQKFHGYGLSKKELKF